MILKKWRGETIKQIFQQPILYLGILLIGSSAGCESLGNREVQVQPSPTQPTANLQNNPKNRHRNLELIYL